MKKIALLLSLTLGLAACSSAPTRYYTLMPPVTEGSAAARNANLQFEMSTVRIPVQVDQPQLVVRQDSGTLAILETQRWSAPLVDEFHDALASQMEHKLGTRNLEGLPKQPGLPVLFTSGYADSALAPGDRADAAVDLISKPYRQQELATRLRNILDIASGPSHT